MFRKWKCFRLKSEAFFVGIGELLKRYSIDDIFT